MDLHIESPSKLFTAGHKLLTAKFAKDAKKITMVLFQMLEA
jgi:hypothetical protein